MSGGQGLPTTLSGVATVTETQVAITSPYKRGAPNSNGTQPTPSVRARYLRELRIANLDATNNLLVRINNALKQVTLKPNATLELKKGMIHALSVQSSAATVAYDVVGIAS